jgi:anti-anti-sigma factor
MALAGSSFFTVTDRPPPTGAGQEARPSIIWLRGEHDIATDGDLRRTLARAIAHNNAAIVVDLSKVEFISASTLGVIVAAWNSLRQESRSLTMRSPSPHVRRVIGICGLQNLLSSEVRDRTVGTARKGPGPRVEAHEDEQPGRQPGLSAASAKPVPVHVGQVAAWRETGPDEMPT